MIGATLTTVTKQYDWRGVLRGYRGDSFFIPTDPNNTDCCLLLERIENGACQLLEPEFTSASWVYGEDGTHTGYDTNLGFAPNDEKNQLFVLLNDAIKQGKVTVEEPQQSPPQARVHSLIFCHVLGRKWPHLKSQIERNFPYIRQQPANPLEVCIRIRNVPDSPEDAASCLRRYYRADNHDWSKFVLWPIEVGTIELEVPVENLLKIFRNERLKIQDSLKQFIDDSLDQHFARTGRDLKRGPNTEWLLIQAGHFLNRFFADMGNMAIRAFSMEYGGPPPGHMAEDDLLRSQLIFARMQDGECRVRFMGGQSRQSFELSDWPEGKTTLALRDPTTRRQQDFWDVASRVRQLIEAGFAIEAVVVANAFIETLLKQSFMNIMKGKPEAQSFLEKSNHRDRLKIFRKIVESRIQPSWATEEFLNFLVSIEEVYRIRNDYAHELTLPVEDPWKIVDMDMIAKRELEFMLSPHTAGITIGCVVSGGNFPQVETINFILAVIAQKSADTSAPNPASAST